VGPAGRRADELLELGDRIAELARSIQVAEAQMMRLIVEFDARRGWAEAGFSSCAEWLAWRVGVRLNAARERVRTARALVELPLASAAMAEGKLSYAKARALTRVATAESEKELLALAEAGSAESLERVVRAWKAMDDAQELTVEQMRHRNRRFSVFVDDDGSYVVNGRLDPETGAMLMRAVEAASDLLFREEQKGPKDATEADCEPANTDTTPAQRRADAVGLLAERALAAGLGDDTRGTRAERYQVLLHVEPDTLMADRPSGRSELDGVRVCRETARRLTCDAGVARVTAVTSVGSGKAVTSVGRGKAVASVGRRTRTVPPALRRALLARDRGCRFPACGSRFVDAHHIVHWADGGPTALSNLVLLCRRHHRAVHEDGMRICMDRDAAVVFFTGDGRALAGAPAPSAESARALPSPPASSAPNPGAARFTRDCDLPWHIEARVWEALEAG
jgi:5-methylcytosine-specific restriction endonuclease McrA